MKNFLPFAKKCSDCCLSFCFPLDSSVTKNIRTFIIKIPFLVFNIKRSSKSSYNIGNRKETTKDTIQLPIYFKLMTWRIHPYLSFPSIISYSITDQVKSYKNKLTNVINSFSHGIKRICKCLISFLIQTHVNFFQCKKLDTYIYRCQRNINSKILVGSGGCSFFCINSQNNIILALYVIHSINMIMIHRTKIKQTCRTSDC